MRQIELFVCMLQFVNEQQISKSKQHVPLFFFVLHNAKTLDLDLVEAKVL